MVIISRRWKTKPYVQISRVCNTHSLKQSDGRNWLWNEPKMKTFSHYTSHKKHLSTLQTLLQRIRVARLQNHNVNPNLLSLYKNIKSCAVQLMHETSSILVNSFYCLIFEQLCTSIHQTIINDLYMLLICKS